MSIKINSLVVKGLGPIASLEWRFNNINLIYGKNEQGKTFIVEYMLRSLFKHAPKTRDVTNSGQILVSGLSEHLDVFHPSSKIKLEDIVFSQIDSLPVDLTRLLVVKAGNQSFTGDKNQLISKSILKTYLSDQRLYESIINLIPKSTQQSDFEQGVILPARKVGEFKELEQKERLIEKIREIQDAINNNYSQGQIKNASIDLEEVKRRITLQHIARRIYAKKLADKINDLDKKLESLPEDELERLKQTQNKAETKKQSLERINSTIQTLEPECLHYGWLKTAINECEKHPEGMKRDFTSVCLLIAMFSTFLSVIMAIIRQPFFSITFGIFSVIFLVVSYLQYRKSLHSSLERNEVKAIFNEFNQKFGENTSSLTTLKNTYEIITPKYHELELLNKQKNELINDLINIKVELFSDLSVLCGAEVDDDNISLVLKQLSDQLRAIQNERISLDRELAITQVQPKDYLSEELTEKYDPDLLRRLENLQAVLQSVIKEEQEKLNSLKYRISDITGDVPTTDWEVIIDNLRQKLKESIKEIRDLKANIIAGILLSKTIVGLQEMEDDRIQAALNTPVMSDPIEAVTHQYKGVMLEGEEIIIFSDIQRFPLAQMSSGAQEQILMAIRIGLASHILGDQRSFLILDDAFQHSDWERRMWLVDEMGKLSNLGWQIFYFTMDDHIKMLFEERIKPQFEDRYAAFDLKN